MASSILTLLDPPEIHHEYAPAKLTEENEVIEDMEASVRAVENLLKYRFKDKKLLEEALTHSSYTGSPSYQRLEFVGDAALGLAVSSYLFLQYPAIGSGKLTTLRAANISTENLARVAVRHRLYMYVRRNVTTDLDEKVREFVMAVNEEEEPVVYGGLVKAPKVLADIVESVAAAVYVDCNFDPNAMWMIIRNLLEPIVMLDVLEQNPQPVTLLYELCRKDGKRIEIDYLTEQDKHIASVFVNGEFVTSASSHQQKNARLQAAMAALQKLSHESGDVMDSNIFSQVNRDGEIIAAKQKLHELCVKKRWRKPHYKLQKECGLAHEKKYICSVEIEIAEGLSFVTGNEKPRVKEAENSAASVMLHGLKDSNYL